ncbi:MAG: hypothetical protein AAF206_29185, partial [Bacteroidota bacterium]
DNLSVLANLCGESYPARMKAAFSLIILALLSSSALSQNPLFVGFEHHYQKLESLLGNFDRVHFLDRQENKQIVVRYNEATVTYQFNRGYLYKIDMAREFTSARQGKEAFEGCMRFFQRIAARQVDFRKKSGRKSCVTAMPDKLYHLSLEEADEKCNLVLSSHSPIVTPFFQLSKHDYDLLPSQEKSTSYVLQSFQRNQEKFL